MELDCHGTSLSKQASELDRPNDWLAGVIFICRRAEPSFHFIFLVHFQSIKNQMMTCQFTSRPTQGEAIPLRASLGASAICGSDQNCFESQKSHLRLRFGLYELILFKDSSPRRSRRRNRLYIPCRLLKIFFRLTFGMTFGAHSVQIVQPAFSP